MDKTNGIRIAACDHLSPEVVAMLVVTDCIIDHSITLQDASERRSFIIEQDRTITFNTDILCHRRIAVVGKQELHATPSSPIQPHVQYRYQHESRFIPRSRRSHLAYLFPVKLWHDWCIMKAVKMEMGVLRVLLMVFNVGCMLVKLQHSTMSDRRSARLLDVITGDPNGTYLLRVNRTSP